MSRVAMVAAVVGAVALPGVPLALPNINSEDGKLFDFQADTDGSLSNGSIDAYDGCYGLRVGGVAFNAGGAHAIAYGGRGWYSKTVRIGDFDVQRSAFVPEVGGNWARYIDQFTNRAAANRNLTASYDCNLGSDGGTVVHRTWDGDATVENTDLWAVTDDADGGGDPTLGHVIAGEGADIGPATFSHAAVGVLPYSFPAIDVAPGDTVAIMFFGIQEDSRALATAAAEELVLLGGIAIDEVGAEIAFVENFPIDSDRPLVVLGAQVGAEGGEIVLEARIEDGNGDPLIVSWDLDGDGAFDDSNELTPLVSLADVDGDAEMEIGVFVVEDVAGGKEITRTGTIDVQNVAPTIVSAPGTTARRGGEYRYAPDVRDPAAADTFTFELLEGPDAMSVEADGAVAWSPTIADVGVSHAVTLAVEDDDGGRFEQSWEMEVIDNLPPDEPTLLYPTPEECVRVDRPRILVGNATDLDADPLRYYFEVDGDPAFRSIELQSSPEGGVPEGGAGSTEWTVIRPLEDGGTYYFRVWVTDGVEESERLTSVFDVCVGGDGDADADADADADTDTDTDVGGAGGGGSSGPGCACASAGAGRASTLLGFAALAAILARGYKRPR